MGATDPGWPRLLRILLGLIWPPLHMFSRSRRPFILDLRALYLLAPLLWLLFFGTLSQLSPPPDGDGAWAPWVVAGDGVLSLAFVARFSRTPIEAHDVPSLAVEYRGRAFVGWAFSTGPVAFGFAAFFVSGDLWVYGLGVPFGAVALWLTFPTPARVAALDRRLRARANPVSLLEAIQLAPCDLPRTWRRA